MVDYVVLCYVLGSLVAAAFAAFAFGYGWWWSHKRDGNRDTEDFCTARGTQPWWRIGWSFYAGAVGSWCITTPSQYASFAGIVGVVVYALSCGAPILLIAFFGGKITRDLPHVFSLADFVGWRFGPIAKTLVFCITMFIMCIFLLAEYTTIGTIFAEFVGSVSFGIIIIVGVLTLAYTAYGGLAVSIATDQAQGLASMAMAALLSIYVAVTYRNPIPDPLPPNLGPNEAGWISIFTLMTSLIASSMLNEAFWQRVWASEDKRNLHAGGLLGWAAVVLLVFLSGFGGWLAFTGGLITEETNPNVYLMQILSSSKGNVTLVSNWVGVLVVLLAIIMNMGAVDSLQNGMASSISGQYLKNMPLIWTRVAVVAINIPLVVIATRGFQVLSLFLIGNLLTACAILPLLFGLIPVRTAFFTETGFVLGTIGGVLALTGTGIGLHWNPADVAGSFSAGASWAWFTNNYDWRAFLAVLAGSAAVNLTWCSAAMLLRRFAGVSGPGISLLMRIPGMRALTASPDWERSPRAGDDPGALPITGAGSKGWARDRPSGSSQGSSRAASAAAAGRKELQLPASRP